MTLRPTQLFGPRGRLLAMVLILVTWPTSLGWAQDDEDPAANDESETAAEAAEPTASGALGAILTGAAGQPESVDAEPGTPAEATLEPAVPGDDAGWADDVLAEARERDSASDAPPAQSGRGPFGSLAVFFLGAGLVVIAGWVLARRHRLERRSPRMLRHIQSIRLGGRQQIAVVEAGGRLLVVGVADRSIRLLTELQHEPLREGRAEPSTLWGSTFLDALAASAPRPEPSPQPRASLLDELKGFGRRISGRSANESSKPRRPRSASRKSTKGKSAGNRERDLIAARLKSLQDESGERE